MPQRLFILPLCTLVAIIALSACKPTIDLDLFIQDLYDVAKTQNGITVPAIVGIPIDDSKKCEEAKNKMLPILRKYSLGIEFIECKEVKGEIYDMMSVKMDTQILSTKDSRLDWSGLFSVFVFDQARAATNLIEIYLLATNKLGDLSSDLDRQFLFQTVDIDDVKIELRIKNDTKNDVELSVGGARVDGKPIAPPHPFKLTRRDYLKIVPSKINVQYLLSRGFVPLALIAKEGKFLPDSIRRVPAIGNSKIWNTE